MTGQKVSAKTQLKDVLQLATKSYTDWIAYPSPSAGMLGYTASTDELIFYDGSQWQLGPLGHRIQFNEANLPQELILHFQTTGSTRLYDDPGELTTQIWIKEVNTQIKVAPEKSSPVGADKIGLVDSEDSDELKYVLWSTLSGVTGSGTDEDAIHDNVAGEINAISEKTLLVADDEFIIEDSAASYVKKKIKASVGLWNYIKNLIDSITDISSAFWVLDEDNMASDSDTQVATQQSVKAYVDSLLGGGTNHAVCQGRLCLTSLTPVKQPDSQETAKTTIYFSPYKGDLIGLYDGADWTVQTFTERSLSLSGFTANTNYDIFIYDNSGTLTLEETAWSSDTSRATALTTQNGILVKSGATTKRYLGTIRITSTTGQCENSDTRAFVWNYYNRIDISLQRFDTTAHTYNTATDRAWNNDSTQIVEFVLGVFEEMPIGGRGAVDVDRSDKRVLE